MNSKALQAISKAKADLVCLQPFYATLILTMPCVEDASIPTLATNGKIIKYNPEFINSLSLKETVFGLAHEVLHCLFLHCIRRGDREPGRWNVATDYVINDMLVSERVGTPIKDILLDRSLAQAANGVAEKLYAMLPEDTGKDNAPGEAGSSLDSVEDGAGDAAGEAELEAQWKIKGIQAANAAKAAGTLTAGQRKLVDQISKPRVDWKQVLRRFLTTPIKHHATYSKPKRRFMCEDIILPSLTGERMGSIVVAVDCSGSTFDDATLKAFASEIAAIVEDVCPTKVEVIYFDTEVARHDTFECGEPVGFVPTGGGGTAFSPVFEYIEKNDLSPVACVVLTDLYCDDYGPCPEYPVLWVSTGKQGAPWGEIVSLRALYEANNE